MRCGTNHTSFFSKIFVVSFRHVTLNSGFSGNFVLPGYLPVTYPDVIKKGFKRQPASPVRSGHRPPAGRPAGVCGASGAETSARMGLLSNRGRKERKK